MDERGHEARRARLALVAGLVAACGPASAQEPAIQLSGYFKSLVVVSRTLSGESYGLDLNRLRLQAQGPLASWLAMDLQYDNEVLLGDYLHTAQFRQQKDRSSGPFWDAQANYFEGRDVYGRHGLYRASATVTLQDLDVKLGRQRIAWGTGRFWSPLDLLNPPNPIAIEREERQGVDAVLATWKFGPVSRASAVYAPRHGGADDLGVQWHGHAGVVDYSLVGGRLAGQDVIGMDLATQVGDAGIRAELTHQRPEGAGGFGRAMLGLDYAFANTLTLSAELYYNGAGARDPAGYDLAGQAAGRVPALATRYAGLYAGYEITSLLKWATSLVFNLDDGSHAIDTRLAWSVQTNLELGLAVQRFGGTRDSEFRRWPNTWLVQLQWFF
jgi:hypothetical protein